jgi:hypothetical protein
MYGPTEKNFAIDILVKYMTHELAEIRSGVYCSIAMLVAVRRWIFEMKGKTFSFRAVCQWKKP